MGTSIPSQPASDQGQKQASRNGLITFAGTMMVIVGVWHVIVGVTALVNGKIYINAASTIYSFDLTGWG